MGYVGWLISDDDRKNLLREIPPQYPDVIAHHVTLEFGVPKDHPLPDPKKGVVVGVSDDGEGIQAIVVEIDGTTDRPDGSTYHITWSLDKEAGYKPVHSNDLIKDYRWHEIMPIEIDLIPFYGR